MAPRRIERNWQRRQYHLLLLRIHGSKSRFCRKCPKNATFHRDGKWRNEKKNRCHVTALEPGLRRIHPAPGKDLNYILRTNKKAT